MTDREKVIKGLECCVLRDPDDSRRCAECPKSEYGRTISNSCINGLMVAALALLKTQEPVEPQEKREGDYKNLYCGACGRGIVGYVGHLTGKRLNVSDYCNKCGKAVKWK